MLKLSKLADYATVLMAMMAQASERLYSGQELSERSGIPAPTVAKLLKKLLQGGLLQSSRGAHGGYRLARDPERISVADIIAALEGPIAVTECLGHHSDCTLESDCSARANWRLINLAIHHALEAVTLAQMAGNTSRMAPQEVPLTFHPRSASPI
ncbi:SUF system Fe-S cluster assembly regulator [Sinimarinibacterium sp. CAU 1509]|uniref:SUF system Fe-S cluster assembly regulator n=1 Tax=Sinimarinibacterium sp. CAU 1509 TaxID=2562283 RepID=UPI0010AC88C9|nr:SUF system Fe-S cluster assembly regulator [Sinimarinibacterium sp. CAU 1509]TJY60901.1 SUF system Fe-S cluster assembly regulator [Sinimarinibacterium sp. CAU 1509]